MCFNRVLSGLNTTNAFSFSSSIVTNFEGYALFFTFFTVVEFSRYVTSQDISTCGIYWKGDGGTFLGMYEALFFCASRPFTRFFFCASTPLTSKPEGQPLKLHEERERKEDECTKREEQARLGDTEDQTYLLSRAFTESVS